MKLEEQIQEKSFEGDPVYLRAKNSFQVMLIKRYVSSLSGDGRDKHVVEEEWVDKNSAKFRIFFDELFSEDKEHIIKILKEKSEELDEYLSRLEANLKEL